MAGLSLLRSKLIRAFPALAQRRAAALVEFAIVSPVLAMSLFGMGDIALALFSATQTTNAAEGLADLATQAPALQVSDMNNIYNAAYLLMRPLPSTNLLLRVSNIVSNGAGYIGVYWSCGQAGLTPLIPASIYTTTPGGTDATTLLVTTTGKNSNSNGYTYAGANTSFIIVEAKNTFTPVTKMILKTPQVTTTEAVAYPRLSTYIGFPWSGTVGQYPVAPLQTLISNSLTFTANGATITCNYRQ